MTISTAAQMRLGLLLAACALALSVSGCATITRGTTESWTVQTDPAGATVSMSNGFHCDATPCSIVMPRKYGFTATISKPGYKTVTAEMKSENAHSGAIAGNLLIFGGIAGAVIDSNNGARNNIVPNPLSVTLVPDDGSAPAASASSSSSSN